MRSVCVYCGSSAGKDHVYVETAIDMGKTLAKHRLDLVYGGGNIGIMGIVSIKGIIGILGICLLYTSQIPRDQRGSGMTD